MSTPAVRPGVLDLFCGAGGISWGFAKADFRVLAGVDCWDKALATFAHNHAGAKALNLDLSAADPQSVLDAAGLDASDIDVIVGGPPCQGFSKNRPAACRFLDDPRNQMFRSFLKFVEHVRPKAAVIENVAEIYNAFGGVVRREIVETLEGWGYEVAVRKIDMSKFGVPQRRRGCIFLASRVGALAFPQECDRPVSAWEAISDLPIVNQGEGRDGMPYGDPPCNAYQRHMRKGSDSLYNHVAHVMKPLQTARLASIGPGQGLKDMPPELRIKGGYSGVYGRLDYESPAPTITRWVFHIGGGRFSHPRETRTLTMREAARLQSFSDDFHFLGTRVEQAGQIGNAVPPLFMERLAACILPILAGVRPKGGAALNSAL